MNIEDVKKLLEDLKKELQTDLKPTREQVTSINATITKFDKKFVDLFKRCDSIKATADNASKSAAEALATAKLAEENIATMRTEIDELTESNKKIKDRAAEVDIELSTLQVRNAVLQHRLEDQTNRSCRKTLVFRGVQESSVDESWEDTKNLLADVIAEACDQTPEASYDLIERCHRSSAPAANKKKPRSIYACFYDWNDSEFIKDKFRQAAIKKCNNGIFVEQKYGEDTTWRRNQALLTRKKLLADKVIVAGYVDYPAKLMVKCKKEERRYQLHQDFSEMEIPKEAEQ